LFNDHPFGTFDAWSGRRPPHQSRRFGRKSPTSGLVRSTDIAGPPRQKLPLTEVSARKESWRILRFSS
jgi:hypothetical protein